MGSRAARRRLGGRLRRLRPPRQPAARVRLPGVPHRRRPWLPGADRRGAAQGQGGRRATHARRLLLLSDGRTLGVGVGVGVRHQRNGDGDGGGGGGGGAVHHGGRLALPRAVWQGGPDARRGRHHLRVLRAPPRLQRGARPRARSGARRRHALHRVRRPKLHPMRRSVPRLPAGGRQGLDVGPRRPRRRHLARPRRGRLRVCDLDPQHGPVVPRQAPRSMCSEGAVLLGGAATTGHHFLAPTTGSASEGLGLPPTHAREKRPRHLRSRQPPHGSSSQKPCAHSPLRLDRASQVPRSHRAANLSVAPRALDHGEDLPALRGQHAALAAHPELGEHRPPRLLLDRRHRRVLTPALLRRDQAGHAVDAAAALLAEEPLPDRAGGADAAEDERGTRGLRVQLRDLHRLYPLPRVHLSPLLHRARRTVGSGRAGGVAAGHHHSGLGRAVH